MQGFNNAKESVLSRAYLAVHITYVGKFYVVPTTERPLKGQSWQTVVFELARRDRNMKVRFFGRWF